MNSDSDQTKVLKEILKWIKVSGIKDVKPILEDEFKDDIRKQVYQLSDGTKGTQEIAKIVKVIAHATVFQRWKSWEKLGLGESIAIKGGKRFQRSFDLEDFGIKVLEVKTGTKQTQPEEQPTTKVEQNA